MDIENGLFLFIAMLDEKTGKPTSVTHYIPWSKTNNFNDFDDLVIHGRNLQTDYNKKQ